MRAPKMNRRSALGKLIGLSMGERGFDFRTLSHSIPAGCPPAPTKSVSRLAARPAPVHKALFKFGCYLTFRDEFRFAERQRIEA